MLTHLMSVAVHRKCDPQPAKRFRRERPLQIHANPHLRPLEPELSVFFS